MQGIEIFKARADITLPLPFVEDGIAAGVFSTAENWLEPVMDLNETVVKNPLSTYYGKIRGNSLNGIFLYDGDLLVIDRAYTKVNDFDLMVCVIDGEAALRYYTKDKDGMYFRSANLNYPPVKLEEEMEAFTWGKVTWVFTGEKSFKNRLKIFDKENRKR